VAEPSAKEVGRRAKPARAIATLEYGDGVLAIDRVAREAMQQGEFAVGVRRKTGPQRSSHE
jgi:hypothetical protein